MDPAERVLLAHGWTVEEVAPFVDGDAVPIPQCRNGCGVLVTDMVAYQIDVCETEHMSMDAEPKHDAEGNRRFHIPADVCSGCSDFEADPPRLVPVSFCARATYHHRLTHLWETHEELIRLNSSWYPLKPSESTSSGLWQAMPPPEWKTP